jgi:hypothetical protein
MGDVQKCEPHGLPSYFCELCRAIEEERERIIALLEPNGVPEYWVERISNLVNGDSE